ncbi:MAG: hypothetical protein EON58_02055 [Alphaproteobacteria bacterium]|nr:MAG: hypothetical protein EON58_02055 [Alphaproteobacteria bacterium]
MSLIDLAETSPNSFDGYNVQQIVAICGDGTLLDGSDTSKQFRSFLAIQTPERLRAFANYCLEQSFPKSGQVLQDIVNEIGKRLSYGVVPGRYSGSTKEIGFDGLWKDPDGALIVEVKTTDAYRINLDTVANYARRVQVEGIVATEPSILIVVGRQDTGDLEAQVRGSKHAWQVRLVSVESLCRLMLVKDEITEATFIQKVRKILLPFEYTRVDEIIDLVFETQKEVEEKLVDADAVEIVAVENGEDKQTGVWVFTPSEVLDAKRKDLLKRFFITHGEAYSRITRAQYLAESTNVRAVCSISKRYDRDYQPYWYAFHPAWLEFLEGGSSGFLVLGCMDRDEGYALPVKMLQGLVEKLNRTEKSDRFYWHIALLIEDGKVFLNMSKTGEKLDLTPFAF